MNKDKSLEQHRQEVKESQRRSRELVEKVLEWIDIEDDGIDEKELNL